jgi:hypothetical protein
VVEVKQFEDRSVKFFKGAGTKTENTKGGVPEIKGKVTPG